MFTSTTIQLTIITLPVYRNTNLIKFLNSSSSPLMVSVTITIGVAVTGACMVSVAAPFQTNVLLWQEHVWSVLQLLFKITFWIINPHSSQFNPTSHHTKCPVATAIMYQFSFWRTVVTIILNSLWKYTSITGGVWKKLRGCATQTFGCLLSLYLLFAVFATHQYSNFSQIAQYTKIAKVPQNRGTSPYTFNQGEPPPGQSGIKSEVLCPVILFFYLKRMFPQTTFIHIWWFFILLCL